MASAMLSRWFKRVKGGFRDSYFVGVRFSFMFCFTFDLRELYVISYLKTLLTHFACRKKGVLERLWTCGKRVWLSESIVD